MAAERKQQAVASQDGSPKSSPADEPAASSSSSMPASAAEPEKPAGYVVAPFVSVGTRRGLIEPGGTIAADDLDYSTAEMRQARFADLVERGTVITTEQAAANAAAFIVDSLDGGAVAEAAE